MLDLARLLNFNHIKLIMKTDIKKLPQSEVVITVELSPEELKPFLEKAAAQISQQVKIDGFRPGKAPYDMVVKKVGEAAILEEALDSIVSKTYYQAIVDNQLTTIGQPKIEVEKLAPGNALIYKATAPVLPSVELGDWKKIKLARKKIEIKSEQVDKVIADIKKLRSKEKIVERPAKTGDRLEIDFDVLRDNVAIENGKQAKYPITIGEGRFIPGFEEQLIGLKAGDTKEFELVFPEKYYQKDLAGQKATFQVKCNAVYEVELPEIDDEFAKTVSGGQYKTAAELTSGIKDNLGEEEKNKEEQRLEVQLLDQLVQLSKFDELPEILLVTETERMIHEIEHTIAGQGVSLEDYLKSLNKTLDQIKQEFRPQAEQRVKSAILAREIFQSQKLSVEEKDIDQEIDELLKRYPANPEAKKQFMAESYREYLRNMLGNRKVIEFLKKEIGL
mgnify:CR=1 FL=1